MEAVRQRAQVWVVAAWQTKEEENKTKGEGASLLTPKATGKGVPKRKDDGKDDRPLKKVSITLKDKLPKKLSPPKLSHGVGKSLMMTLGPVTQGPDRYLLTHKDYTIEVIESIIKDMDVDPCVEQATEELQALGLFDLAWVHFFLSLFIHFYA